MSPRFTSMDALLAFNECRHAILTAVDELGWLEARRARRALRRRMPMGDAAGVIAALVAAKILGVERVEEGHTVRILRCGGDVTVVVPKGPEPCLPHPYEVSDACLGSFRVVIDASSKAKEVIVTDDDPAGYGAYVTIIVPVRGAYSPLTPRDLAMAVEAGRLAATVRFRPACIIGVGQAYMLDTSVHTA